MLLWPEPAQLLRETLDNHRRLGAADGALLQNVPLPEVRRRMRQWIGHRDEDALLFANGHQAELHHPGVWVKNALINAAAATVGGEAYHFSIDTDAPKHLQLRWPGRSVPLTDVSPSGAAWSGLLEAPTRAHLKVLSEEFGRVAATWRFESMVGPFLASLRRLALEATDLPSALTNAVHELDWGLGLRYHALISSPLCVSEPYLLFVHHVLARADAFAADYNAALGAYRIENKIRAPGRPMPDLKCVSDGCEVPFWLDSLEHGTRARAAVARQDDCFALRLPNGDSFVFDARADGWDAAARLLPWLARNRMRLAPRALTLTAVLRLLAADQFVHGIGGGQYDQVLDLLIARHFGIEPPRFSVTTATLYFPEAIGQPRVCLPCIASEGRRLKHDILGPEKMRWVREIESLPRHSARRADLFFAMQARLTEAWARPEVRRWEQRMRDAEARAQEERVLFDRELFYAIQPASRLMPMIEHYRDAFAAVS